MLWENISLKDVDDSDDSDDDDNDENKDYNNDADDDNNHSEDDNDDDDNDDKGLFTYYFRQKWRGPDPPLSAKNQKLGNPPPHLPPLCEKIRNQPTPHIIFCCTPIYLVIPTIHDKIKCFEMN